MRFCNETLTVRIATAKRCSTQQAACRYRLFGVGRGTWCDLSICFAVTSLVLPPTEYKIINRTCDVERQRNGTSDHLYNEKNFLWRRSEQSCNCTRLVIQGVLVRFLHLGRLMAPRRMFHLQFEYSLACSKQSNACPTCPFQIFQLWLFKFNFHILHTSHKHLSIFVIIDGINRHKIPLLKGSAIRFLS